MHTSSPTDSPAAVAAHRESALWAAVADRWQPPRHPEIWADLVPVEAAVIPDVDPSSDLERRAQRWGYPLEEGDLSDLARFAAALARTEGEAWEAGDRSVATLAYEHRRFLAADRVLPWAVPWLRAAARCFPESRTDAEATTRTLLDLGERHRLAPYLSGTEGLVPPGHDGYGPLHELPNLADRIGSLWGGMVVFDRSLHSLTGRAIARLELRSEWSSDGATIPAIATWYEDAAVRWEQLAAGHPGTARFWLDLAQRCLTTVRAAL